MTSPNDVRQFLDLPLIIGESAHTMLGAYASVAALTDDGEDLVGGAWFDDYKPSNEKASGVHIRLVAPCGVITLDHEFSFDGLPDARLTPWSRVRELHVIAERIQQTTVVNLWLDVDGARIEFAGIPRHVMNEVAAAIRKQLT